MGVFLLWYTSRMPRKAALKKNTEVRFWSAPLVIAWVGIGLLISVILAGLVVGAVGVEPTDKKADLANLTLVERVSRHISTPQGEEPTVATVEDPEAMRQNNPSFYEKASEGDVLLIWSQMAVLYSPDQDLVLSVLPLNLGSSGSVLPDEQDEEVLAADLLKKEQELAKIEVLNGTFTPSLAREVSDELELAGFATLRPRDARQKGYANTLIIKRIDVELPETIRILQEMTGGVVEELPAVETVVNGDIIIIIGADYQNE